MMTLYHYCSNKAVLSIVNNQKIWLTSASLSNDSMEGKLVTAIIDHIAKADGLDQTTTQRLQESVSMLDKIVDGLCFCLSEDGDLLSQWRGYADDATGVSIGFSKDHLEYFAETSRASKKAGFTLQRVEYDPEVQESLVKPTYIEIKKLINEGAFKTPGKHSLLDIRSDDEIQRDNEEIKNILFQLSMKVLTLVGKLFLLKTRAFREEHEWRLISYFIKTGKDVCSFRALRNRIVPYREIKLLKSESSPIAEVILGPRNMTPNYVMERFLKQNGFVNVKVSRSEATYRG